MNNFVFHSKTQQSKPQQSKPQSWRDKLNSKLSEAEDSIKRSRMTGYQEEDEEYATEEINYGSFGNWKSKMNIKSIYNEDKEDQSDAKHYTDDLDVDGEAIHEVDDAVDFVPEISKPKKAESSKINQLFQNMQQKKTLNTDKSNATAEELRNIRNQGLLDYVYGYNDDNQRNSTESFITTERDAFYSFCKLFLSSIRVENTVSEYSSSGKRKLDSSSNYVLSAPTLRPHIVLSSIPMRFLHSEQYQDIFHPYVLCEALAGFETGINEYIGSVRGGSVRNLVDESSSLRLDKINIMKTIGLSSSDIDKDLSMFRSFVKSQSKWSELLTPNTSVLEVRFAVVSSKDSGNVLSNQDLVLIFKKPANYSTGGVDVASNGSDTMDLSDILKLTHFWGVVSKISYENIGKIPEKSRGLFSEKGLYSYTELSVAMLTPVGFSIDFGATSEWCIGSLHSLSTYQREFRAISTVSKIPLGPYILRASRVCSVSYLNRVIADMKRCIESWVYFTGSRSNTTTASLSAKTAVENLHFLMIEYLKSLDMITVNGEVLTNCNSLGKLLKSLGNPHGKFYVDEHSLSNPGVTAQIQRMANDLIEKWTVQIKTDHKKSAVKSIGGGVVIDGSSIVGGVSAMRPTTVEESLWATLSHHFNSSQMMAISRVCNGNATATSGDIDISLIQGPPGTGKSRTVLGIIAALLGNRVTGQTSPILVCAPSNVAVDELIHRLSVGVYSKDKVKRHVKLVRLGKYINRSFGVIEGELPQNETKGVVEFTLSEQVDRIVFKSPSYIRWSELSKQIISIRAELQSKKWGKEEDNGKILRSQLRHLYLSRQLASEEVDRVRAAARNKVLQEAEVIVTTLSTSGSDTLFDFYNEMNSEGVPLSKGGNGSEYVNRRFAFDTVIVDEAAQCTEPSLIIPLRYACTSLVLIGDARQLPATVLHDIQLRGSVSSGGSFIGLTQSYFERLELAGHDILLLNTQYRMHPMIREFPSDHFYYGKIKDWKRITDEVNMLNNASISTANDILFDKGSLVSTSFLKFSGLPTFSWVDTSRVPYISGKPSGEQVIGKSYVNHEEVSVIMEILTLLSTWMRALSEPVKYRIGIISPYKAQVKLLLRSLHALSEQQQTGDAAGSLSKSVLRMIDVNTVDGFQGQERDVIIVSTVRTNTCSIGFVADERRLNVAITRAKRLCCVVGRADVFGSSNSKWSDLVNHLSAQHAIIKYPFSNESSHKNIE